jgi:hypothetical protein
MDPFAVSHFSDRALLHDLKALVAQDRKTTAVLLTRIAEVDERKLYLRAGHDSMYAYCLHELHFSEGAAYKHIHAARAARRFPGFLVALAEIELLLARCFPRPGLAQRLQAIPPPLSPTAMPAPPAPPLAGQLTPECVQATIPDQTIHGHGEAPPSESPQQQAPAHAEAPAPRARMTPLAPERFGLQLTIDQETYDLLQRARALMSHQVPTGEIAPVIKRALELLVADLEKRKTVWNDRLAVVWSCRSRARGTLVADRPPRSIAG